MHSRLHLDGTWYELRSARHPPPSRARRLSERELLTRCRWPTSTSTGTFEHRVIWCYPGQPRDPAWLELGLVGVEPEVALAEWERLVGLLQIADREGVER